MTSAVLAIVAGLALTAQATEARLAERHRLWLDEEVWAIITESERRAFLDLAHSDERDAFVVAFWEARDPTPGTPRNEVRDEHERRIAQADRLFRRGGRVRGSRTVRGRVWVQLGPPRDRSRYGPTGRLHPIELWLYQTDGSIDLPNAFWVMFYRRGGGGPWRLYDPYHGPDELLGGFSANHAESLENTLRILRDTSPTLLHAALTLLPGELPRRQENLNAVSGGPQWAAIETFGQIQSIPERLPVADDWVERHLRGEAVVEVEFVLRDLGLRSRFVGVHDDGGRTAVRYAIEIPPAALGVLRFRDRISGALQIVGRIVELTTEVAIEIDESVELTLTADELAQVERRPLVFHDDLPLLPGRYAVDLIVRNLVTREFGLIDDRFVVPATPATSEPDLDAEDDGAWRMRPRRDRTAAGDALAYGDQHRARGDWPRAIASWEGGLAADGDGAPLRARLGDLHLAAGEDAAAVAVLAPLVGDPSATARDLVLLGLARSRLGQTGAAIAAWEVALRRDSEQRDALNLLAEAHAAAGHDQRAIALVDRSLALEPDQPAVRRLRAQLLER